jgi:hypothetical protein
MTQAQINSCLKPHPRRAKSCVRVGDIFDISVKDTVEIQGLIEKQKTVISGHTTLIDFLPPQ